MAGNPLPNRVDRGEREEFCDRAVSEGKVKRKIRATPYLEEA